MFSILTRLIFTKIVTNTLYQIQCVTVHFVPAEPGEVRPLVHDVGLAFEPVTAKRVAARDQNVVEDAPHRKDVHSTGPLRAIADRRLFELNVGIGWIHLIRWIRRATPVPPPVIVATSGTAGGGINEPSALLQRSPQRIIFIQFIGSVRLTVWLSPVGRLSPEDALFPLVINLFVAITHFAYIASVSEGVLNVCESMQRREHH